MVMKFMPLPWKPELIFTGTSVMGINPETGKFCSHVVRFVTLIVTLSNVKWNCS